MLDVELKNRLERNFKYWWMTCFAGAILIIFGMASATIATISVVTIVGFVIAAVGAYGTVKNLRKRGLMR